MQVFWSQSKKRTNLKLTLSPIASFQPKRLSSFLEKKIRMTSSMMEKLRTQKTVFFDDCTNLSLFISKMSFSLWTMSAVLNQGSPNHGQRCRMLFSRDFLDFKVWFSTKIVLSRSQISITRLHDFWNQPGSFSLRTPRSVFFNLFQSEEPLKHNWDFGGT